MLLFQDRLIYLKLRDPTGVMGGKVEGEGRSKGLVCVGSRTVRRMVVNVEVRNLLFRTV